MSDLFSDVAYEPPVAGSEFDTLVGTLERQRRVMEWKTADLDASAMAVRIAASEISLGGLLRHLTRCEGDLFRFRLDDSIPHGPESEWVEDWAFTASDDVERVRANWRTAVRRSRDLLAAAMADGGLDRAKGHEFPGWGAVSIRRLLADAIEEYARHLGHADLIREAIDGRIGEDVPE